MMTIRAGLIAAIAGCLIFFVIGPISDKGNAFAEVQAQVERARTVQYVMTSYDGDSVVPDAVSLPLENPSMADAITRLQTGLDSAGGDVAETIKAQLDVFRDLDKGKVLSVQRVRILGKHLERTDQLFPYLTLEYSDPTYTVRSARDGLMVTFNPARKEKQVLTQQVVHNRKTGETTTSEVKKIPTTVDFFAKFRSIPAEATESLPKTTIDGKDVIGFRSVEKHGDESWTRTYWVKPDSKLPVEIVTEVRNGNTLLQRWIQDHFVFDEELSDDLFSTETPEGWKSKNTQLHGFAR
ncbi:MAG: hypothetical protein KDB00_25930 [Planctomycetales bacterium]|nr:hypothetical protein [Planctomycetales bacterium]